MSYVPGAVASKFTNTNSEVAAAFPTTNIGSTRSMLHTTPFPREAGEVKRLKTVPMVGTAVAQFVTIPEEVVAALGLLDCPTTVVRVPVPSAVERTIPIDPEVVGAVLEKRCISLMAASWLSICLKDHRGALAVAVTIVERAEAS